MAANRNGID